MMLDKCRQPKIRILIRSYFAKLARYNICPTNDTMIAQTFFMAMADVMQEDLTKKVKRHWISVLKVLFRFNQEVLSRSFLRNNYLTDTMHSSKA